MNEAQRSHIELASHYVRQRDAMAIRGDFGVIFEDYYLHMMQIGVRLTARQDELLKEALACLTLHLMARPRNELSAWTINLQDPPLNLFVTGDSEVGNVVGRAFTEAVKVGEQSLFFSQVSRPKNPLRQSTVEIEGDDVLRFVERYYDQSEQLPARFFRMGGDQYAVVVAVPDIDMKWLETIDVEAVRRLEEQEELGFLERRRYHFGCGCNLQTILALLASIHAEDPEEAFLGEDELTVTCPRCAGTFVITPDQFGQYLDEQGKAP